MTARPNLKQMRPDLESWSCYPMHTNYGGIEGGNAETVDFMFARSDGSGLLYPGRSHSLFGPSESGKSWLGLMAIRDLVRCIDIETNRAMFFDFEGAGFGEIAARLLMLGLTEEELWRVRYVRAAGPPTPEKWENVWESDDATLTGLSVVDSVNGALTEMGLSGNSTEDVVAWHKAFIDPLMSFQPAVLLVDHSPLVSKNGRAPAAIGSQAKRAMLTGVSYRVDVRTPLRPGQVGELDLYASKDRPGAVRRIAGPVLADGTQHAARVRFDATDPVKIVTAIDPPPEPRTDTEMADLGASRDRIKQRVCATVGDAADPPSQNDLVRVTRMDRGAAIALIKELVEDGYLGTKPGKNRSKRHVLLRPFGNITGGPSS